MITINKLPKTRNEVITLLGMTLKEMNDTVYNEYIVAMRGPYISLTNIEHYTFELKSGKIIRITELDNFIIEGEQFFTFNQVKIPPQNKAYTPDLSWDRCFCQM